MLVHKCTFEKKYKKICEKFRSNYLNTFRKVDFEIYDSSDH